MSLADCLKAVCDGRSNCVGFESTPFYQSAWVKPYNLDLPVVPAAVIRPNNAEEVAGAVKCGIEHEVHVQAKSGGHSYAYVYVISHNKSSLREELTRRIAILVLVVTMALSWSIWST